MYRRIISNTVISAVAFLLIGLINLLLVPFIVAAYGLAQYGLLMLARVLLPNNALGIFDFGYSELATQIVTRARENGDWKRATASLRALGLFTLSISVVLALLLSFGAMKFTTILRTPAEYADSFARIVLVSAIGLPVLFLGVIGDGILKGFEAFHELRRAEVLASMAYGTAAVLCILIGAGYGAIAYVFLASQLLRVVCIATIAWRKLVPWRAPGPNVAADWRDLFHRGRVLAGSRLLGALQHQSPPLIIGTLLGPASVGAYDIATRLPRFLKVVLALLNSTIFPVAARLDFGGERDRLRRLLENGLLGVAMLGVPVTIAGAVFSEGILHAWQGPAFASLWASQAAMFAVAAFNVMYSFGGNALLMRREAVSRFNMITIGQIVLQYSIAALLLQTLQEHGFILGQFVAVALSFPVQMWIVKHSAGVENATFVRLAGALAVTASLAGLTFLSGLPGRISNLVELAGAMALWISVSVVAIFLTCIPRATRSRLLQALAPGRLCENLRSLWSRKGTH